MKRLQPIRDKNKDATWQQLVLLGFANNVELVASHMYIYIYIFVFKSCYFQRYFISRFSTDSHVKQYMILGTCVTEVTCDILTGEHNVDRVDLQEDAGQSLSPGIDIGQMEGAFVMGLGYYTCENLIYDDKGGLLTNNTWTYKVPGVKDIPEKFRIKFKQNSSNPTGVLNSKCTSKHLL